MKTMSKSLCSAVGVACMALLAVTAVAQPEPTLADPSPAQLPATQPADSLPSVGDPWNLPVEDNGEGYSALENGPVHEAFAEQYSLEAPQPFVIPNEPPPPVDELPPDVKPEGAIWVPGYWTWLEETSDFVWVSGVWRIAPPGRQWVPGHWSDVETGFQWTAGFWAPGEAQELTYLPPPPTTLEVGPSSPAPSPDYFWVPGCWTWNRVDYSWQPGHWHQSYDNWLWMPSRFFYTPRGCIRLAGYWDRPFARRGLWFAPVHFHRPIYRNPGFFFRPRAFINIGFLTINIYRSPNRGYFYGNYAGPRFANAGFVPWFGLGSGRHYDPFFAYESLHRSRTNPNWINDLRRDYRQLADASVDFNRDRNRLDRLDGPGRFNDGPFGDRIIRDVSLLDPGRTRDFEALRDIQLDRVSQNEIRQAVERSFDRVSQIRAQRERIEQIESRIRDRVNQDGPGGNGPGRGLRDRDAALPGNDRPSSNEPGDSRPGTDGLGNNGTNNDRPDVDRPGRDNDSPRDQLPGRDPMNDESGSDRGKINDRLGTPDPGSDRPKPPTLPLPGRIGDGPPAMGDGPGRDVPVRTEDNDRPGSRSRDRIGSPNSDTPSDRPQPGIREGNPGNRLQLPSRDNNSLGGNNLPTSDGNRPGLSEGRPETPRLRLPGADDTGRRPAPNLPGTEGNRLTRPDSGINNQSGSNDVSRALNRPMPPSLGSPLNDGPANVPRFIPSRPTPQPRNLNVPNLNLPTKPPAGTLRQRSGSGNDSGPSTRSLESPVPRINIPSPRLEPTPRSAPPPRINTPAPAPRIDPTPRQAPAPRIAPPSRPVPAARAPSGRSGGDAPARGVRSGRGRDD